MIPQEFPFIASLGSESGPTPSRIVAGAHLRRLEDVIYHVAMRRLPSRPACVVAKKADYAMDIWLLHAELTFEQDVEIWASLVLIGAPEGSARRVTLSCSGVSRIVSVTSTIALHSLSIVVRSPVVPASPSSRYMRLRVDPATGGFGEVGILAAGSRSLPLRSVP